MVEIESWSAIYDVIRTEDCFIFVKEHENIDRKPKLEFKSGRRL